MSIFTKQGGAITLRAVDEEIARNVEAAFHHHIVIVDSETNLVHAKQNVKDMRALKSGYKAEVKPFKQFLDHFHKKITATEKSNVAVYDSAIKAQESGISEYKAVLYERQQELKRQAEEKAKAEAEELRKEQQRIADEEAARLLAEAEKLQDSGADDEDVAEKVEEADRFSALPSQHAPVVTVEKAVLKKDEVKQRTEYSIRDKDLFIRWALRFDHSMLRIEPNMAAFNKWVKQGENFKFPFVKTEIKY